VGSAQPPRSHADARRAVAADVPPPLDPAPTTPFAPSLRRLARLIKADAAPPVAHVTLGGWDTHVNQGTSRGRLAERLGVLAAGLAGFAAALGPRLRDMVLMTWTEFGRSVRENANGGTDHGAASAALVLGGPVRRGHVVGRWPGLHDETGVAATTGVGELAAELLGRHVDWPPPREGGGAHAAVPGA
jgi:uncharacterized protein (DUF1501 family)